MCTNYQINQIVYDGSVLYAENVLLNNSRLKGKCYGFIIIYYLHCCDCRLAIWQWTSVKLTTIFTYCVDARWIYCLMLCFNLSSRFSSEFRKKKHKLDSTSTSLLSYQNIIYFCFFFFQFYLIKYKCESPQVHTSNAHVRLFHLLFSPQQMQALYLLKLRSIANYCGRIYLLSLETFAHFFFWLPMKLNSMKMIVLSAHEVERMRAINIEMAMPKSQEQQQKNRQYILQSNIFN